MSLKPILAPYVSIAKMLTATLGESCEAVLHDLSDPEHSVVFVSNGTVTGRCEGDCFDHLIRQVILSDELRDGYTANYFFTAPNGKLIRSSTLLIRGTGGKLEGALCLNFDTAPVMAQMKFLSAFLPPEAQKPAPPEKETLSPADGHVAVMIENLITQIAGAADPSSLTRNERIEKIRFMEAKGIFLMKGSVEKAAEKLGISKVTVYSYLDEIKGKR